jgi:hypothetical protein
MGKEIGKNFRKLEEFLGKLEEGFFVGFSGFRASA